jgi:hypothetical protein
MLKINPNDTIVTSNQKNQLENDNQAKIREILRYTIKAPSSHNTQCWRFRIDEANTDDKNKYPNSHSPAPTVTILPDFDRACPVVDPDNHHLYATLGCALENFVHAALALGFQTKVDKAGFEKNPQEGIRVELQPCQPVVTDLFEAIPIRQVTRGPYDGALLSADELSQLQDAGSNPDAGVAMIIIPSQQKDHDGGLFHKIQELILEANTIQLSDAAFKQELARWVRFNDKEIEAKGDGLAGKCTGNPSAPRFIGGLILNYLVNPRSENAKIQEQLQSSVGLAVFVATRDDPAHWLEAGRCYERFALKATSLGIRNAFLNQPVEVPSVRKLVARELGLVESARPSLLVRFGKGPTMPFSARRPLETVIVNGREEIL